MGLSVNAEITCNKCNKVEPIKVPVEKVKAIRDEANALGWTHWTESMSGTEADLCPECSPPVSGGFLVMAIRAMTPPPF